MIRVVVTGSESTGKTTLAERLAADVGTICVPEFVRGYAERKGAALDAGDVEPIARGQMAAEDAGVRRAIIARRPVLVLDTDLLSTLVYAEHYYGPAPAWLHDEVARRAADLYLLCEIDVPWVPDPQRDRPDRREEMHALFASALARLGRPVVPVRGGWEERLGIAVAAVSAAHGGRAL